MPLSIDTWTIASTLVTGAVIGMLIIFGGVALIIRFEMKEARRRRVETPQLPVGLTIVNTQDQVYDHDKKRHVS
jgi:Flp pilus assembly protein TadB